MSWKRPLNSSLTKIPLPDFGDSGAIYEAHVEATEVAESRVALLPAYLHRRHQATLAMRIASSASHRAWRHPRERGV